MGVKRRIERAVLGGAGTLMLLAPLVGTTSANDGLAGVHWARRNNPFVVELGGNASKSWKRLLQRASGNWNRSAVVQTRIVAGGTNPGECNPTDGMVEVCSARYGKTNWLGLTRVFFTGDHIDAATVRLNDTYFRKKQYDDGVARLHTVCHELGHALGLDHPGGKSCMNDSQKAVFRYDKPAAADYARLDEIYAHADRNDSARSARNATFFDPLPLPPAAPADDTLPGGETVRIEELGDGRKVVTIISWKK